MKELKPCPFCGEKAILRKKVNSYFLDNEWINEFVGYSIECMNSECEASVRDKVYIKDCVKVWNTRT
jgi:Lar family restriction alleviation protein